MTSFLRAAAASAAFLSLATAAHAYTYSLQITTTKPLSRQMIKQVVRARKACTHEMKFSDEVAFVDSDPTVWKAGQFGGCVNGKLARYGIKLEIPRLVSSKTVPLLFPGLI